MELRHWFYVAVLLATAFSGIQIGRESTKHAAIDRAGWLRPARVLNERTERFNRLFKRLNDEGRFELVWLDADCKDGLEEPPTPEIVTARVP